MEIENPTESLSIDGIEYVRDSGGCYIPASYKKERTKIRTPKDALPYLTALRLADQEYVYAVDLDGANQVIGVREVTKGLVNSSSIHPREVFRGAIQANAVSVMIAHNHPSGNLEPSEGDLMATRRMVECSRTLGISILDHLIVAGTRHLSIRERYPAYFS